MKSVSQEVLPEGSGPGAGGSKGTVVIGTVSGDIHDIGKDIVALMLGVGGYTVHDLGTDVPVEGFVAAIEEHDPDIVGLSGLLTLAFDAMKSTVDGIAAAGLRDTVKIMIGGAPVDENVRVYTGADGWGNDVGHALKLAAEWTDGGA
jgi:5-methyltetrahydrofolate--homocysteine methyltransferase